MDSLEIVASLFILTLLEIILGIDNLVFLSLMTERLPLHQRARARRWGLFFAWLTRLLFLFSALWISKLTYPLVTIFYHPLSYRDIFLFLGGIFLLYKATDEIHQEIAVDEEYVAERYRGVSFHMVVLQVALLDIVFSFDSVLTAIGLTDRFWLMAMAISIAILVMLYASVQVTRIIEKYPAIKMLALGFLILIGMTLVAEGSGFHIPRGYIYFAMAFSLGVECLNIMRGRKRNARH